MTDAVATPLRVLLIEDSPDDAELLLLELRRAGFECDHHRVDTRDACLEALREPWDVALLDYALPQLTALDILDEISGRGLDVPTIVVSGTIDEESAVSALRAGARDFVTKQHLARLAPAVRRELASAAELRGRRATEAALRESEARFTRFVENARDILIRYRVKPDISYEYVSPAVTRILGYTPEEFYADPELGLRMIHPDDREAVTVAYAADPEAPVVGRLVARDGRIVWIDRRQVAVRDEHGEIVAFEAIARDVTERIEADLNAQAKFRAVFEGAHDAMLIMNDEKLYIDANDSACELLGLTHGEIVGKRINDIFPPDETAGFPAAWDSFIEAGSQRGESTIRRPDGETRITDFSATANIKPGVHLAVLRDVTEVRRAEEALRATEERFRSMVEELPLVVFSMPIGAEEPGYVSPRVEELFGIPVSKWLEDEDALWVAIHPDDQQRLAPERQNDEVIADFRFLHPDGRERFAHVQRRIVRAPDGSPLRRQGFLLDITELKESRDALERTEDRYRLVVENSTEMISLLGLNGTILYASPAHERILGHVAGDGPPPSLLDFVHPEEADQVAAALASAASGAVVDAPLVRIRNSEGHWLWAEGTAAPIRDEQGQVVMILVMARDVSARVEAATRLQTTQERLELALEAGQTGWFDWNPIDGRLRAAEGIDALLGLETGSFEGTLERYFDHVPAEDHARVQETIDECFRDGKVTMTHRIVRPDGSTRNLEVRAVAHYDEDGAPSGMTGIVTDVTDRTRASELEDRLRQAQKMEAIGQLAGGVAHDFNNLLTVINGYSDIALASCNGDDALRESITEIRRAGDRASDLTRQLLAFSRQQVLQMQLLDVNEIVSEHRGMLSRLLGEDVDVRISLDARAAWVEADPGQLAQVIFNLAANARDAMPAGGQLQFATRTIKLASPRPRLGLGPGEYVVLEVSDTGCGMDPETRSHVFEPFFTTKEPGKGTGLGLATVHGIVEQSGGRLEFETEVGSGTTFRLYLPRVAPPAAATNGLAQPTRSGTETVLLVEDDAAVRNVVEGMLAAHGYRVITAATPDAALSAAAGSERIDVLLTDVVMPEMNGRDLAERLLEQRPGLATVYMSGFTDDAMIARGVLSSETLFVQKPFSAAQLTAKLREALAPASEGQAEHEAGGLASR